MKKLRSFLLLALSCQLVFVADAFAAGMTIKKAAAVEEQKPDTLNAVTTGGNLLGTALNLYAGVQSLKQQEDALTKSCAPSNADVAFVNKMVQEYAKTGQQNAAEMMQISPAKEYVQNCLYKNMVGEGEGTTVCYDAFDSPADKGKIWELYPKASEVVIKCPPENTSCNDSQKKYYSNVFEIYAAMNWSDDDLLPDEVSTHAKLMAKAQECDPDVLKRKKREMTGSLITSTIGGIGQKQGSGDVMQQVSGLIQNKNSGTGTAGAVGQVGLQMLPGLMGGGQ